MIWSLLVATYNMKTKRWFWSDLTWHHLIGSIRPDCFVVHVIFVDMLEVLQSVCSKSSKMERLVSMRIWWTVTTELLRWFTQSGLAQSHIITLSQQIDIIMFHIFHTQPIFGPNILLYILNNDGLLELLSSTYNKFLLCTCQQ